MKKFLPWFVGLLVVFIVYLYASPYLVLNNIKNAAQQGDADKLSVYVDFPSVKQSIKDQVKATMVEKMAASDEQEGFEALGTLLAAAMIDPIIDGVVTPDGVALMLQGQKLDFDLSNDSSEDQAKAKNEDIEYKAGYLSFNRFKVQIINADNADESIDVILHRNWLSWKVTRISFSLDSKDTTSERVMEEPVAPDFDLPNIEDEVVITEDDIDDVFHGLADEDFDNIEEVDNIEAFDNIDTDAQATEITEPLTPAQAAHIDYLVDNDIEISQDLIELLNDFTLGGGTESDLREFIIERSDYDDGYDALKDCRNPDLTKEQFINTCT